MSRNASPTMPESPTPARDAPDDSPPASSPRPRYRVTAFEALMLAQDTPTHPMTAQLEAAYRGTLDRAIFELALARTLENHPLLQARLDSRGRPRRWIRFREGAPVLDWADVDAPLHFPQDSEYMDLIREAGLRVWIRAGREGGQMVFQFHHACTDGTGVMEFFLDLLRNHDAIASGRGDASRTRNPTALRRRDRFHKHSRWGRLRMLGGAVMRGWYWTRMQPIPLGEPVIAPATIRPMETILHTELPANVLEQLLAEARDAGVTLNDLLLRDLFLVLSSHGPRRAAAARDCLVICMPVNLRLPHEPPMPAANKLMLTFLHRMPRECEDPRELLRGLHIETQQIKRTRRGLKILEVLRLAMKVSGRIPEALLKKSSFATAVLTNLGRVEALAQDLPRDDHGYLRTGGLTIDRIVTAPNGQPGTAAVFVASTYASRLTIAICHDPAALPRERARTLLANYVDQLRTTAGVDADYVDT